MDKIRHDPYKRLKEEGHDSSSALGIARRYRENKFKPVSEGLKGKVQD
ncbi:MAG: hypothetical protein U0R44_01565 [Candidatus Micrarchaeia archaeon]